MDFSYITEEAVLMRNAARNTPEWEQETKIDDAIRCYVAKLMACSLENYEDDSLLKQVNISCIELKRTRESLYYKATYSTVYTEHVGFALEEFSKGDTSHCLSLRVVMQHSDPSDGPWLAQKRPEDQCVRFARDLWEREIPVTVTTEDWTGNLTCSMQLPGLTDVPAELADAWKKISDAYTTDGGALIEDYIEEYEGSMSGGAFVTFEVKGDELPDLLAQLQALGDACSRFGGGWSAVGYLFSGFSVLSFETDEDGKITAQYLAV